MSSNPTEDLWERVYRLKQTTDQMKLSLDQQKQEISELRDFLAQQKQEISELRDVVYLMIRSKLDPQNMDLLLEVENKLASAGIVKPEDE